VTAYIEGITCFERLREKVIRRISDLLRELITEGHKNYISRFVIGTVYNFNVIGSMKMKQMVHVV
jgi:hypothetical protein